ncbi:MAG: integration host factor subunit beta [Halieaceae bacterium]
MTRSELIDLMADSQNQLSTKDVELAVKLLIDHMSETLSAGQRIEIRGFGSFSLHYREPRQGRNPRTGDAVDLRGKHVPHFKTGKELRDLVNRSVKTGF